MSIGEAPFQLVAISAGTSEPSTSRLLADRAAEAVTKRLRQTGRNTVTHVIELAPLALDITRSLVSGILATEVQSAVQRLAAADGIIASAPVYKAGISGLFKSSSM